MKQKITYYHSILIGIVVIICLLFVVTSSAFFSQSIQNKTQERWGDIKDNVIDTTTKAVGATVGTEMIKDNKGNINILLLGYGGDGHQGGYLTDSIIVASIDPINYSVSMISIPRDLFVNMSGSINKINSVFAFSRSKTKNSLESAQVLGKKLTEITGLPISYYMLIDFNGFSSLIDKIGGINVDVPFNLIDRSYPGPNWSYTTFSIKKGPQILDGSTALKYARSRHSTSDFSRSQRQQLIIQGILDKLNKDGLSIATIKVMYETYTQYITTNINLDEMLGLLKYGRTIPKIHSFGYTYECANSITGMRPGCLLYPVNQEERGASGMLPYGSSRGKMSFYDYTIGFGQFVSYNQSLFNEGFTFSIHNAIDPSFAKSFPYRTNIANNLGIKMKRYGLTVNEIKNSETYFSGTKVIISGEGDYKKFIKNLGTFMTIDDIELHEATVDLSGNILPNHIDIYLGNTFIEEFGKSKFPQYFLPLPIEESEIIYSSGQKI